MQNATTATKIRPPITPPTIAPMFGWKTPDASGVEVDDAAAPGDGVEVVGSTAACVTG